MNTVRQKRRALLLAARDIQYGIGLIEHDLGCEKPALSLSAIRYGCEILDKRLERLLWELSPSACRAADELRQTIQRCAAWITLRQTADRMAGRNEDEDEWGMSNHSIDVPSCSTRQKWWTTWPTFTESNLRELAEKWICHVSSQTYCPPHKQFMTLDLHST